MLDLLALCLAIILVSTLVYLIYTAAEVIEQYCSSRPEYNSDTIDFISIMADTSTDAPVPKKAFKTGKSSATNKKKSEALPTPDSPEIKKPETPKASKVAQPVSVGASQRLSQRVLLTMITGKERIAKVNSLIYAKACSTNRSTHSTSRHSRY